jgi:hypothetical protein
MTRIRREDFRGTLAIDFEFATTREDGLPDPHVFCALELTSGRRIRLIGDELKRCRDVPFDIRHDLVLAYNFVAESTCFEVLGWRQPWWPLDCYAEFMAMSNGLMAADVYEQGEDDRRWGFRIEDALRFYGCEISAEDSAHKKEMQLLAARGEPFTPEQWEALAAYCEGDTDLLAKLFCAMETTIDWPAALIRGRYMTAVAQHTFKGIPVDVGRIESFKARRSELKQQLIDECAGARRFYPSGRFNRACFFEWADEEHIGMPRHPSGAPILERDTLKKVARLDSRIAPFAELRSDLSLVEDFGVSVRSDGRIRPNYMPLRTRTGRNKSQASRNLMLQAKWTRGFIMAPPGHMLAQLDYKCQEVYIAAVLSEDHQLLEDLRGDPYLKLAIRSGLAPANATAETHDPLRDQCKVALLSLIYGAGPYTLASNLDLDLPRARAIWNGFHDGYPDLCEWLGAVVTTAYATLHLESPLGWPLVVGPKLDSYTLRNHIIQATGGDILRVACLLAQDAEFNVITTLHDSILLEEDANKIQFHATMMSREMSRAAELVIGAPIPVKIEFIAQRYQLKGNAKEFFADMARRLETTQTAG